MLLLQPDTVMLAPIAGWTWASFHHAFYFHYPARVFSTRRAAKAALQRYGSAGWKRYVTIVFVWPTL